MSDYGVKIGIKADTGIMLLKPSIVFAVVSKCYFSQREFWHYSTRKRIRK